MLIWLILSDRMSLPNPRAIGRPRWIWFSIFVGGATAVAVCGILDLFGLSGLIAKGWADNLAILFLAFYVIAYWPIGTLSFTSPALLPAVPLATRVR